MLLDHSHTLYTFMYNFQGKVTELTSLTLFNSAVLEWTPRPNYVVKHEVFLFVPLSTKDISSTTATLECDLSFQSEMEKNPGEK